MKNGGSRDAGDCLVELEHLSEGTLAQAAVLAQAEIGGGNKISDGNKIGWSDGEKVTMIEY
jgi:membrane-bound inhibitor of C-type lysozyme